MPEIKKLMSFTLALALVLALFATAPVQASEPSLKGHVLGNDKIGIGDAQLAFRAALKLVDLTPTQLAAADLNDDGKVDMSEAMRIFRYALGLSAVLQEPAQKYSDTYLGAPQGSAKFLEGRTLLVSIFVDLGGDDWNKQDIASAMDKLNTATTFIENEGKKYEVDLEFISDFDAYPDLRYDMDFEGEFFVFPMEANVLTDEQLLVSAETNFKLQNFIGNNVPFAELADKYQTDSIAYVIFVNKPGRSYSYIYAMDNVDVRYHEKLVIFNYHYVDIYSPPSTCAHELLHLFGAVDLYFESAYFGISQKLVDYVKDNYPNDIMFSTNDSGGYRYDIITKEISPITAYLLGWLEDIPELTQFPEFKNAVTAAFYDHS